MKAYYKQGWGITMLTVGGLLLLINIILIGSESASVRPQLFISIMLPVMGIFYLTKPCFEITENKLLMFNLFGMTVKTYHYNSLSDLSIRENKMYINEQGAERKVRMSRLMIKDKDWEAMVAYISANSSRQTTMDAAKELHSLSSDI